MQIDQILEEIKIVAQQEVSNGNTTESNSRLENCELLWAALALLGHSYTQLRGSKPDENAAEFWPFGKFEPSDTAKENLVRSCQLILFEIDRLNNQNKDGVQNTDKKE